MKIVGYQIILRITRFVTLVIRPDYQKFCIRSTPGKGAALSAEHVSSESAVERQTLNRDGSSILFIKYKECCVQVS